MSEIDLPRVLCVDDEVNVLSGLERNLRRDFPVVTAVGGQAALDLLRKDRDFGVIISDMRMPGMDGATFFSAARLLVPHAARMLLTGQADLDAVIKAVNGGSIHYYLKKPTEKEELLRVVHMGFATYRENLAHGSTVRKVIDGGLNLMLGVLEQEAHGLWSRATRVRTLALDLGAALQFEDNLNLGVAAVLASLGEDRNTDSRRGLVDEFLASDEVLSGAKMALEEVWSNSATGSAVARVILAAMRIDSLERGAWSASERDAALAKDLDPRILVAWRQLSAGNTELSGR